MRAMMPHTMPVLNERMDTSLKADAAAPTTPEGPEVDASWTWAAAQSRLAHAYDEGGAQRWAEQLAREAEAEARIELARRQQTTATASRPSNGPQKA